MPSKRVKQITTLAPKTKKIKTTKTNNSFKREEESSDEIVELSSDDDSSDEATKTVYRVKKSRSSSNSSSRSNSFSHLTSSNQFASKLKEFHPNIINHKLKETFEINEKESPLVKKLKHKLLKQPFAGLNRSIQTLDELNKENSNPTLNQSLEQIKCVSTQVAETSLIEILELNSFQSEPERIDEKTSQPSNISLSHLNNEYLQSIDEMIDVFLSKADGNLDEILTAEIIEDLLEPKVVVAETVQMEANNNINNESVIESVSSRSESNEQIKQLQEENSYLKRQLVELEEKFEAHKKETRIVIQQIKLSHEQKINELITDFNKQITENKFKQWCAFCSNEASCYCCWHTSYCDTLCQTLHWKEHSLTCTNQQNKAKYVQNV